MNIKDFKVGQKVYVLLTGNAARGISGEELIEEWEVMAVGRKLVKASKTPSIPWTGVEFDSMDNFHQKKTQANCNINYILYANKQDIYDEWEKLDLMRDIKSIIDCRYYKHFSLESLRKAKAALMEREA